MTKITSDKLRREVELALQKSKSPNVSIDDLRRRIEKKLKCSLIKRKYEFTDIVLDYIDGVQDEDGEIKCLAKSAKKTKCATKKKAGSRKQCIKKAAKNQPARIRKMKTASETNSKDVPGCSAVNDNGEHNFSNGANPNLNQGDLEKKSVDAENCAFENDKGNDFEEPSVANATNNATFGNKTASFSNAVERKKGEYDTELFVSPLDWANVEIVSVKDTDLDKALNNVSKLQMNTKGAHDNFDTDDTEVLKMGKDSRKRGSEDENAMSYPAHFKKKGTYDIDLGSDAASEGEESAWEIDTSNDESTQGGLIKEASDIDELDCGDGANSDPKSSADETQDILDEDGSCGSSTIIVRNPAFKRCKPTKYSMKKKIPKYVCGYETDTEMNSESDLE